MPVIRKKWKKVSRMKKILIILGIVVSVVLFVVIGFVTTNNHVIVLEEQIKESESSIKIQEKRRLDLIVNLVDTVKSYNKYEQETLSKIVDARSKAVDGQVEEAEKLINLVVEQYPELKSNENYKQVMTEMSVTENLIAEHRNNYNEQIKSYNKYTKKFPNSLILNMMGYDKQEYEYLNYEVSEDAPTNLWD